MEKLLLKPAEVSELAGLGKSKTYELIASGEIPSVRSAGGFEYLRIGSWRGSNGCRPENPPMMLRKARSCRNLPCCLPLF